MSLHASDALFRDVLAFLDRVDPEDVVGSPQIVDTFAMASPAAPASSPAALLRQLTYRLVRSWSADAPLHLQAAIPPLDLGPLVRVPRWRTAAEQQAQLVQAVSIASWVADGVAPHLAECPACLRDTASALLHSIRKVIADETTTDANGLVSELPATKKGTFRIMSAVERAGHLLQARGQSSRAGHHCRHQHHSHAHPSSRSADWQHVR
jgi:hypothetical protein